MILSPPTIGLTGGIGSGKSTIASICKKLGCIVANADENAKKVLQSKEVKRQLVAWWGDTVINSDGTIDNAAIATIIFNDDSERFRLESLIHPQALKLQEVQFSEANEKTNALVIDAPLLLETGLDEQCDTIIFVDASVEIRQNRVKTNRGWSIEELNNREAAQLPLDTKRKRADYVVINEGELDEVQHQVERILEDIHSERAN